MADHARTCDRGGTGRGSLIEDITQGGHASVVATPLIVAFELSEKRWSAKLHASPRLAVRSENRSDQMAAAKKLTAAILARRASKGSRGKRKRPGPRQYTVAELERARDRVAAAERRIDNDHTSNPNRGRAGLERAPWIWCC
jgi:hypothetical protein